MVFKQILTILMLVCIGALDTVNSKKFIPLTKVNSNDIEVLISGSFLPYVRGDVSVNGTVTLKTTRDVQVVYCDGHSHVSIQQQEVLHTKDGNNVTFIISIPANAAVLNRLLGSKGLKCSALVNFHLYHFNMFSGSKGVQVPLYTKENITWKMFESILEEAPHILWLSVTIVSLAFLISIIIPTCMYIRHRKKE